MSEDLNKKHDVFLFRFCALYFMGFTLASNTLIQIDNVCAQCKSIPESIQFSHRPLLKRLTFLYSMLSFALN